MRFLLCATTAVRSALQQISPTPTRQITYTYDDLNQLKTVTRNGITTEYNYQNGNITSVTQNGTAVKTYGYTDSTWGDLLTSFNGQTITYDEIGNPLQYRDGMSFTWAKGRQLQGITKDGLNASYTYDENGLRISKTVNGITTKIFRTNGQPVGMNSSDGKDVTFILDGDGKVYGVHYDHYSFDQLSSATYYFAFNAQGDVIGIYDFDGRMIATYDYDEWGNCTVHALSTDRNGHEVDSPDHIAYVNPFRYRGYFYDAETGFYYLNSRYYDPGTGRFVNADDESLSLISPESTNYDKNCFAYCDNNPINRADDSGEFWHMVAGAIVGAASVYVGDVIGNLVEGKTGREAFKPTSSLGTYLGAAASGMIPGGKAISMIARPLINTGIKFSVDKVVLKKEVKPKEVVKDLAKNFVSEGLSYGANKLFGNIRPRNYSSFRHQTNRFCPKMTQQQTRSAMQLVNRAITSLNKIFNFSISVFV